MDPSVLVLKLRDVYDMYDISLNEFLYDNQSMGTRDTVFYCGCSWIRDTAENFEYLSKSV